MLLTVGLEVTQRDEQAKKEEDAKESATRDAEAIALSKVHVPLPTPGIANWIAQPDEHNIQFYLLAYIYFICQRIC